VQPLQLPLARSLLRAHRSAEARQLLADFLGHGPDAETS
jgi:hypothetical protein